MTRILLDESLRERLHNLSGPLELCDESGRVVGRVFPAVNPADYEPWEPPFDEEELARRERPDERRYTTDEVIAHLESL